MSENKLTLPTHYRYNLDIQTEYVSVDGIKLFHQLFDNKKFKLLTAINLLRGKELLQGHISGRVTILAEDDYEFDDLRIDYYYSEDLLFDRVVAAPKGKGYSIDIDSSWQPTEQILINIKIQNLLGHIDWKNTPFTTANITSDNKEFDENGYVIVHPALSGQHKTLDFRQKIPTLSSINSQLKINPQSVLLSELISINNHHFFSFGGGFSPKKTII